MFCHIKPDGVVGGINMKSSSRLKVYFCAFLLSIISIALGTCIYNYINTEFYFPAISSNEEIKVEKDGVLKCSLQSNTPDHSIVMELIDRNRRGWKRNFVNYVPSYTLKLSDTTILIYKNGVVVNANIEGLYVAIHKSISESDMGKLNKLCE